MLEESNIIVFKKSLNDKFEKSVIAFLNTNGRNLYLGVDDNGNFIGIKDIDSI